MKTFIFIEKNTSCALSLTTTDEEDAYNILNETVKHPDGWRLDEILDQDDL